MCITESSAPPRVVLDTNVVLDWLVFDNPDCFALSAAIVTGDVSWVATASMRAELAHVLGRGHLDSWGANPALIWRHWDRHCYHLEAPPPLLPSARLHCSDPDDQQFIDLAVSSGARWLVSRDRAVLKLARRLKAHGVSTAAPQDWQLAHVGH